MCIHYAFMTNMVSTRIGSKSYFDHKNPIFLSNYLKKAQNIESYHINVVCKYEVVSAYPYGDFLRSVFLGKWGI